MTTRPYKGFRVGQLVRVHRFVNPPRYRGRKGMVVALNRQASEIGVTFTRLGNADLAKINADSWFLPDELADAS